MSKRFDISSRPRANEVANALSIYTMFWGVPAILQADDGKGFKGAVLQIVKNHGVKVKGGRAGTQHVQGMYASLLLTHLPSHSIPT